MRVFSSRIPITHQERAIMKLWKGLPLLCLHSVVGAFASLSSISSQTLKQKTIGRHATLGETSTDADGGSGPLESRGGNLLNNGLPNQPPPLPTLQQYRKFAIPCLGLWIAQPLLSLVDTSFVGLSGSASQSAQQLAALGPATTFFDGATYLFMFLNVATTNLYSAARARQADTESVVRTASNVAVRCGMGLLLFLLFCTRPLLSLYIGETAAASPGLLDAACSYVQIRALSMPTSLLLGVVQASLLGAKDAVTPLIAILYSTVVNVIGDFVLVNRLHMGLPGAAIATTLAQWAATAALLGPAKRTLVRDGKLGILRKPPGGSVSGRSFLGFAAPVLTLILGKLAAFGFMTHTAAALPGQPTPSAVHQIILSLLFFCSPFFEVISQTAQTFLPAFTAPLIDFENKKKSRKAALSPNEARKVDEWKDSSRKVASSLLGLGVGSAVVVASAASLIPAFFGNAITSDPVVQNAIKPLARYLWLGGFLWAPVAVCEGVLLARRELSFLAGVYLLSTALLPPALLHVKHTGGTVSQVWACFAVFQLFRAACFTARIWVVPAISSLFGQQKSSKRSTSKQLD